MKAWLEETIQVAKTRGILPRHLELTGVGNYYFANAFDEVRSTIISESVSCGFSSETDTAVAKALSEFFEQKAFSEGAKNGLESCNTTRSDGFAAFPVLASIDFKNIARKNAEAEAVERFVWARWWDDPSIGHRIVDFKDLVKSADISSLVQILEKALGVNRIIAVLPSTKNPITPLILVGFLKDKGVVSGGACGEDIGSTFERAIAELYRHALAVSKIRKQNLIANSFYEKRLLHFSSPEGETQVLNRLSKSGNESVETGKIVIDTEVPSPNSDIFYVHRVLFENQPEFIGGKIERFCL